MPIVVLSPEFFSHDAQAGGFYPETHTDPGFDMEKFIPEFGKNYLIEGIRGTGKTHILKMINELCLEKYSERKILPVYISLAKVSEWIEGDLALFRMHLYSNIILSSIHVIEQNRHHIELAGNTNIIKNIKKIAQMFGLNELENFDKIIQKIKSLNEELENKLTYNPEQIIEEKSRTEQKAQSAGISAKSMQITVDDFVKILDQKEVQYVGKTLSHQNASSFIVEYFNQLIQILQHNYSLILLDECSEISKDAQVEVFRLLKLIRGAFTYDSKKNTTYFCASVYPFPVTYYPSKTKGDPFNFEVGNDAIMEYLNLDELSDDYISFFKELTNKRIAHVKNKKIHEVDYLNIFENDRAFLLAAYFSNGIVRRYLEILKYAYDNLSQRVGSNSEKQIKKIAVRDVEEGATIVVSSQMLSQDKLNQEDFVIFDDIVGRIQKRNKKNETENKQKPADKNIPANVYFTVSRSELYKLGNLLIQGALHDKNRTRLKKYHKEGGTRGALVMLDLAAAFNTGAIDRIRAHEIFINDLKKNAKSGYLWCQDFKLPGELPETYATESLF